MPDATRRHKRSKEIGYEVEKAALASLAGLIPGLRRTGSMAYKKAAADLLQDGNPGSPVIPIVVTKDKRQDLLVTMSAEDLQVFSLYVRRELVSELNIVIQCKGRAQSWIGTVYRALKGDVK